MCGGDTYDSRGAVPRAIGQVFRHLEATAGVTEYRVFASYLEVHRGGGEFLGGATPLLIYNALLSGAR